MEANKHTRFNSYKTALEREAYLEGYKQGRLEVKERVLEFIEKSFNQTKT